MDKELNKLSRMNPPKPSDEARQQALARAMQAFEEQKKITAPPKDRETAGVTAPYRT